MNILFHTKWHVPQRFHTNGPMSPSFHTTQRAKKYYVTPKQT